MRQKHMRQKALTRDEYEALLQQKEERVSYWERYGLLSKKDPTLDSRSEIRI